MRKHLLWFLILFAALWFAPTASADGIVIPLPPAPWPPDQPVDNLAIRYHRVTVTIRDQYAITEIDQVFVNELPHEIEGLYLFPLPHGAAISDFAMTVDGELVSGEVLPADQARRIYEETVRRQRDPGLLEYVGRDAFRARIYPIPAQGEKRVTLRYEQLLPQENGLVHYSYPLDTERFSSRPIDDVSVHVQIETTAPLKALYSPSHPVAVFRDGAHSAEIGYEDGNVKPDRDFELYYSMGDDPVGLHLLSYRQPGEDGFFALLVAPPIAASDAAVLPKDVIVVLDTSGSMRGQKIDQAKAALAYILEHLNAEDRFNLVTFSTGTRHYARALQDVDDVPYALDFVQRLEAGGGTNIERALREALTMADAQRPQIVIFLTDGLATEGIVATDDIIASVADVAPPSTRLFTFGIGDEVNTVLLDTIASQHRGASAYVRPTQSVSETVAAFYAKVGSPVLADLSLDVDGEAMWFDLFPDPLPDLFAGSQLVVTGRYSQGGIQTVRLNGTVDGTETQYVYPNLRLADQGGEHLVPRLWATRKIGHLLQQIRLHGEKDEWVDEIVALSVRYGIMTPYTAFLVDENADVLTEAGQAEQVEKLQAQVAKEAEVFSGAEAVDQSVLRNKLAQSDQVSVPNPVQLQQIDAATFVLRDGIWTDTRYDPDRHTVTAVPLYSDAYFALLDEPGAGRLLRVGQQAIVQLGDRFVQIVPAVGSVDTPTPNPTPSPTPTSPRPADPTPAERMPGILDRVLRWLRAWLR